MTESVFPFMFWALGEGAVSGRWPGNGDHLLSGGTPRYRLYPTRDGRFVAVAAIEQKFWETFCALIGLEAQHAQGFDFAATTARVAEIIRGEDAAFWEKRFAGQDCCCTVVKTAQEALSDPQFAARGVFAHRLVNAKGEAMVALPVPLDAAFRGAADVAASAPALGAHNREYLD